MKCINNNKMKCWGNKFFKTTNNTHHQQSIAIHKITITRNNGSIILHPHKMCNINDKDLLFFVFSSFSFHQEPTIKANKTNKVNLFLKVFGTTFNWHILVFHTFKNLGQYFLAPSQNVQYWWWRSRFFYFFISLSFISSGTNNKRQIK